MEDFDRESNASTEEPEDELMVDADDGEDNDQQDDQDQEHEHDEDGDENENDEDDDDDQNTNEHENDHDNDNENENENENEHENENDDDDDQTSQNATLVNGDASHQDSRDPRSQQGPGPTSHPAAKPTSPTSGTGLKWLPQVRPEAYTASTYDIVPTMAAPQATSINAVSITPDLRYWMTGGQDGYIRKYDGPGTINGKTPLTVAQKHPFVESVTKSGILMSYWENAEPQPPGARPEDVVLSPVYSLAVQSQALWLLSGLESGGINLQSVRHDEGKRITCLQQHTNAVSALTLASDEMSVLSGSWDKNMFDWDLNTGHIKRSFEGSGGQISAIETRPMASIPVPPEAANEDIFSDTFFGSDHLPTKNDTFDLPVGDINGVAHGDQIMANGVNGTTNGVLGDGTNGEGPGSPDHDSLFGGSPVAGDDLFGDNFGGDDDNEFSRAMMQDSAQERADQQTENNSNGAVTGFDMNMPSFDDMANDSTINNQTAENSDHAPVALNDTANHTTTDVAMASQQPAFDFQIAENPLGQPGGLANPQSPSALFGSAPKSPSALFSAPATATYDMTQTADSTFLSASIDGTLRIWDRRTPNPIARVNSRPGVPPWCMGACWSPDGNWIYAGRRNGTVEEFSIAKARPGWQPERVFKFPTGSGAVSCLRAMPNGRHLICASNDILRLYDLRADVEKSSSAKPSRHAPPPFLIVPGPPRAGVISSLYIDQTARFMLSAAGTRGWDGSCTEVLIGYEIGIPP